MPGIVVTAGTGLLAWAGTMIARSIRAPAASSAFGGVASTLFIVALASAVVAIFRIPDLERVELAYVAIWVAAYVVLNLGRGRWSVWDRAERQVAYGLVGDVPVDRRPVAVSAAGFLLAAVVLATWVLAGASVWIVVGIALGVLLVGAGMTLGARAWRGYGDPTGTPSAVESARGSV
jgi:O-antigen/teichoic acid export membrane protein